MRKVLCFIVVAVAGLMVGCFAGGGDNGSMVGNPGVVFSLISAERTDFVESTYNRIDWQEDGDENGLVLTLKLEGTPEPLTIFSSDFSLAFDDEGFPGIPRRACIGISAGRTAVEQTPSWVLGGSMSRQFVSGEEPYFSILFPDVPKSVGKARFLYVRPMIEDVWFAFGPAQETQSPS